MKRLFIGLTIVALITAFNAYQHRDNYSETTEYTGYGFSFQYRKDLTLGVWGHPDYGSDPTDLAGIVSARPMTPDENFLQYYIEWSTVQSIPDLEDAGAEYLLRLEIDGEIIWRGSIGPRYLDKDGHQVAYWVLNATQRDLNFMVVHSCWVEPWESLRSYRMYSVDIITPDVGYTTESSDAFYREFMESFNSG